MLAKKIMPAGGGGGPEFVGAATASHFTADAWISSGGIDVSSLVQDDDFVLMAFSFNSNAAGGTEVFAGGLSFTAYVDRTNTLYPNSYIGYATVGDASSVSGIYPTSTTGFNWIGLSIVVAVFRGVSLAQSANIVEDTGTALAPPSLSGAYDLAVGVGSLTDNDTVLGAGTGYSLAGSEEYSSRSSTAIQYLIDAPDGSVPAFTGSITNGDDWVGASFGFNAA